MDIIRLFNIYFLILSLIQGFLLLVIDYNSFKRRGMLKTSRRCKRIGIIMMLLSIVLYAGNKIFYKY
ncbi:CLC_0170 family protein [Clostridium tetani]|uniref:CLC_0170 family protein n=1 Tax=Clostridium tetani TaxID=1513 RepID=UPI0024A9783D|nr:CLC_0170 family protein [Clostridium tetani]